MPHHIEQSGATAETSQWVTPSAYAHYIEARIHHGSGRLEEALANVELALVFDDASAYLFAYYADLLDASGQVAAAKDALEKALKLDREQPYAYYILARIAERSGDLRSATELATRAHTLDPGLLEAWHALIDLYLKQNQADDAKQQLTALIVRWPDEPWGRLRLGSLAFTAGDLDNAIVQFEALVELRPRMLVGYHRLATAYAEAGRVRDAYMTYIACTRSDAFAQGCWLQRVAMRKNLDVDAHLELLEEVRLMAETLSHEPEIAREVANKLFSSGEVAWLKAFVVRVVEMEPKLQGLYHHLGMVHLQNLRREDAIVEFAKVPANSASYLESRAKMAIALSELKRHKEALDAMEGALAERPGVVEMWLLKAALYERAGRKGDALKTLEEARLEFPTHSGLYDRIASIAWKLGMSQRAQEALERRLEDTPDDINALHLLGSILAERELELPRAEALIKRAIALSPERDGRLSDSLGWVYFKMERFGEALTHLEEAVERLPPKRDVLERLGDVYHASGQRERALASYRRALQVARDEKNKKVLRRKIQTLNGKR